MGGVTRFKCSKILFLSQNQRSVVYTDIQKETNHPRWDRGERDARCCLWLRDNDVVGSEPDPRSQWEGRMPAAMADNLS